MSRLYQPTLILYTYRTHGDVWPGEMHQNDIQHHAPPDDPDSLISLLLILLCGLVWFYAYKCYICLPISGHGL